MKFQTALVVFFALLCIATAQKAPRIPTDFFASANRTDTFQGVPESFIENTWWDSQNKRIRFDIQTASKHNSDLYLYNKVE
jgi:hypothetical protein